MTHQGPSATMDTLDSPLISDTQPADTSMRRFPVNNPLRGTDLLKGKVRLPGWTDHPSRNKSPSLKQTYYRVGKSQHPVDTAPMNHSTKKRQSQITLSKIGESRRSSIEQPVKNPRISIRKSLFVTEKLCASASMQTSNAPTARRDPVISNLGCRRSMNAMPGLKLHMLPYTRLTHK